MADCSAILGGLREKSRTGCKACIHTLTLSNISKAPGTIYPKHHKEIAKFIYLHYNISCVYRRLCSASCGSELTILATGSCSSPWWYTAMSLNSRLPYYHRRGLSASRNFPHKNKGWRQQCDSVLFHARQCLAVYPYPFQQVILRYFLLFR